METIEEIIQTEGFYMTAAQGFSMLPFIRPKEDTIVLEKLSKDCAPMEVVLYKSPAGRLVLHRVIKTQERHYLICGDNCTAFEQVKKDSVIAKLTKVYRNEKEIELNSFIYRLYVLLWCRPCHMRILLLKLRRRLGRIVRRLLHKTV